MIIIDKITKYVNCKQAYDHCRDIISSLKNYKNFYIGATSDPIERLNQHIIEKNMKTMYLLCIVPTKNKTESLEKKLISRFDTKYNHNQSGGGEGIKDGINFIYVLFK